MNSPTQLNILPGSASAALAAFVVDDRVLSLGLTNWKSVLDRAIHSGHTDVFDSDDGRKGLRKAGSLYALIGCMPERAVEYVKARTLVIGIEKLAAKYRKLPSSSGMLGVKDSFIIRATSSAIEVVLNIDEETLPAILLSPEDIPFSDGCQNDDEALLSSFTRDRIKCQLKLSGREANFDDLDLSGLSKRLSDVLSALMQASA